MRVNARWYFDVVSPFAYLQWCRLRTLDLASLDARPILFAGLLDRLEHKGPAEIPGKRVFTYRHVVWRARRDGVPLRFPPAHPFNPLPALRLCIAAGTTPAAIDTVFRFVWEEGGSLDTPDARDALAQRLGFADATAPLADDAVKRALHANFVLAQADGVFGVPTLACDGHLFWGEDATDMFLDYARDPVAFEAGEMARVADLPVGAARAGARRD